MPTGDVAPRNPNLTLLTFTVRASHRGDRHTMTASRLRLVIPDRPSAGRPPVTASGRTRGFATAAPQEHTAMFAGHLGQMHLVADARRRNLLAEAEQARRVAAATPAGRDRAAHVLIATVRRGIGGALVGFGRRVQGAHAPVDALPNATIGGLRVAR